MKYVNERSLETKEMRHNYDAQELNSKLFAAHFALLHHIQKES